MDESITLKESKTPHSIQKVGIDTSVLVNLIVKDVNLLNFREKEFSANDSLHYAMQTKYEFKGVLLNRFGFDKKEKNKLWKRVKISLRLNPIKIGKKDISRYLDKVRKANNLIIKQNKLQFQRGYGIGKEDILIIANFLKWKISKVCTSDRAFYETCKVLGLESIFIPIPKYSLYGKR